MRVEDQTAFLIHSRKYTDSKVILELLTEEYGRVGLVHRQSAKSKKAKVQPFTLLSCSWFGRSELKTSSHIEAIASPSLLLGKPLYCAMYVNELLQRCLPHDDPNEPVFYSYQSAIEALSNIKSDSLQELELVLRVFELGLLESLGFGIDFEYDSQQNQIQESAGGMFAFVPESGFCPVIEAEEENEDERGRGLFSTGVIARIKNHDFDAESLKFAKHLTRSALLPLLGDKPLNAKELFS